MTERKDKKTVLIMAGGTGGHIFPALAVAQILHDKGIHIEWLGTKKGLEVKLVTEHKYAINYIDIGGLRGKKGITMLFAPFKLIRALFQTLQLYLTIKPNVVLGMGGFVSGPGGVVARLLGKPLVLHEQNAIAGLTNKLLFKMATKVYAAFPGAFAAHKKLTIIGNPVRKDISQLLPPKQRLTDKWHAVKNKVLNILVIGGSLGAVALNNVLPQALAIIAQQEKNSFDEINVRHQCGVKNLSDTTENYQWLEHYDKTLSGVSGIAINVSIMPFIDNMAENYDWADLLICRAGALTVSEIATVGIASILVPFPYAVDDHQSANAAYLANENAAFVIQQNELTDKKLAQLIMLTNQQQLLTMSLKARQLSHNNAAEIVAEECLRLAG